MTQLKHDVKDYDKYIEYVNSKELGFYPVLCRTYGDLTMELNNTKIIQGMNKNKSPCTVAIFYIKLKK